MSGVPFVREVNEAVDWDSRKTLADVWQSEAALPSLSDGIYLALIAVAQFGARAALENAAADAEPLHPMTAEPSVRDRAAEVIRLSRWLSPGEANPSHYIADDLAAAGLLAGDARP